MTNEFKNYRNSADVSVEKVSDGSYSVNISEYNFGEKVRENSYSFNINNPVVIEGVYQSFNRRSYNTDTTVQNPPLNLNFDGDNGGLQKAFANCSGMLVVNIPWHVKNITGGNNAYAFYKCSSLDHVNLYNRLANSSLYDECSYVSMFEGCNNLHTVDGLIDVSNVSYENLKNMFKGCSLVTGLRIKNGTGNNDIMAENVTVNGVTYSHAYDIMGLTPSQFQITTSLFPNEKLIPEEELNGLFADDNRFNYKSLASVGTFTINYKGLSKYYTNVFANCTSIQSVDLQTIVTNYDDDFKAPFFDNMFYYDLGLVNVNLRDAASENNFTRFDINNSYTRMFYGCQALTTIKGTIDFTDVPTENGLDMFSGCQQLQEVTIKNGTGDYDITRENVIINGKTYDYAYKALGLTEYQMNNVVTLI